MSILLAWWVMPAAITVIGLILALFIVDGSGFMGGLKNLLAIGAVCAISALVWAVAGFLK